MKWTYSIKNKLTASGVLMLLCLLVLTSNYIDRAHTDNVKNMISTLYEDRLIAEEYILKMTSGIYQVKEVINSDASNKSKVNGINNLLLNIKEGNRAYQETKLTKIEIIKAKELATILREFDSISITETDLKLVHANMLLGVLNQLSNIQLNESKQIMKYAESLYASSKTSSQFVFALIIVILFVLQALIFSSKTLMTRGRTKSQNLN